MDRSGSACARGLEPVTSPDGIGISIAAGVQVMPAVASGTNYIVAWEDRRAGRDIYCARVSVDGAVLDPGGIPIATEASDESQAAAVRGSTARVGDAYQRFAPEPPYLGLHRRRRYHHHLRLHLHHGPSAAGYRE